MPRLFSAIEIPPSIADRLTLLRAGLTGARWIDPENYHLTLRFIGDVDGHTARERSSPVKNTKGASGVAAGPHLASRIHRDRRMERMGLEPTTPCLQSRCSPS